MLRNRPCPGYGVSMHELREREPGVLGDVRGRVERRRPIARQAEDERAEHVHAVLAERAQPRDQRVAGDVEALVDVLQPFGRDRLDADQRALDVRARRIASRNSGSSAASIVICVKNTMSRGSCASRAISSKRSARIACSSSSRVWFVLPPRHREVGQRDRIEVVVGQRDEAEPAPAQLDDLCDDGIDAALPRLLAVGAPDRAERAVLRAAAHGLHRGPHVPALRQQVPARRQESVGVDAPALVDPLQRAGRGSRPAPPARRRRRRP